MLRLNLGTLIVALAVLLLFTGAAYLAGVASASSGGREAWSLNQLTQIRSARKPDLVERALRILKSDYFMEIDEQMEQQLLYGAVEGMTSVFRHEPFNDNFTHFYDPELFKDLEAQTSGEYAGVGILMGTTADGMYPEIITVFPDTPAEEGGLQAEDIITSVDDEDAFGMILPEVATRIKGEPETTVQLGYYRPAEGQFLDIELTRRHVQYSTITDVELLADNVGFIRVTNFAEQTGQDFRAAVKDLLGQGMQSLVIDLRNNAGGLYQGALEIADMFIKDGAIVKIQSRGEIIQVDRANPNVKKYDIPLVVLINGQSASSSEILVGALKDHGLCTVVGQTSYGKGVIQAVNPMDYTWADKTSDNGESYREQQINTALALTIGKYYTPFDHDIHGIGIEPQIWFDLDNRLQTEVELTALYEQAEAKLEELTQLRTQANQLIREHDAMREKGAAVARLLAAGQDVPDEPRLESPEEEHSPASSLSPLEGPASAPREETPIEEN